MKIKILALLTALSIIFTTVAADSTTESVFRSAEAEQVLVDLGFMQNDIDGNFHPEAKLTRADFAYLAVKMSGGLWGGKSENELMAKYADYYSFEREAQAADAAVERGYLAAYSDGLFHPDEPVSYMNVVRFCINLLGYNLYEGLYNAPAETSYLMTMAKLPYLSRLNLKIGEPSDRGIVAYIAYETLNCDMVRAVTYGKQITYEIERGHTIFTDILKIETAKGRVDANEFTHIDSAKGLSKGCIKINGVRFTAPNAFGLLGYDVKAYYSSMDDENKILSIVKKTAAEDETVILSENIRYFENGRLYIQTDDGTRQSFSIDPNADIVYNGVAYPDYPAGIFKMDFGEVRVIDNSGGAQTVLITSYEIGMVSLVDYDEKVIYDQYDSAKKFNYGDNCLFLDAQGGVASERSVAASSVILIAKSIGNGFVTVKQPSLKTTGVIQEVTRENGKITNVSFGQTRYAVASNARGENMAAFAPGMTVTFFIERGIVVASRETVYGTDMKAGYLVDVGYGSGLDKVLQLKILTTEGELKLLDCESKIRVDNASLNTNDSTLARAITGVKGSVIRYTLSQTGTITDIDLPYFDVSKSDSDKEGLRLDYKTASKLIYRVSQRTFDGKVNLNGDTVLFAVPDDGNEEVYSVFPISSLINGQTYLIDSYCMGSEISKSYAAVLHIAANSFTENASPITVVEKITTEVGENGETTHKIYGLNQSGATSVIVTDEELINGIEKGDVIRWQAFNKKAYAIEEIFDVASLTQKLYTTSTYSASLSATYKNVYSYNDGVYQLTAKTDMPAVVRNDLTSYILSSCATYIYDSERKSLGKGSAVDIRDYKSTGEYSKVFLYVTLGTPKLLVIYR